MWAQQACEALQKGLVLELRYDGYVRHVEVHAVGTSTAGHPVMRCWQLRGGSVHNEPTGWKMMRLDEARGAGLTGEISLAPRPGYRRGDRQMQHITAQL